MWYSPRAPHLDTLPSHFEISAKLCAREPRRFHDFSLALFTIHNDIERNAPRSIPFVHCLSEPISPHWQVIRRNETYGRSHPSFPLLPQSAERARIRSSRCVLLKRTWYYTLRRAELISNLWNYRTQNTSHWESWCCRGKYFSTYPRNPICDLMLTWHAWIATGCHRFYRQWYTGVGKLPTVAADTHIAPRAQQNFKHPTVASELDSESHNVSSDLE